MLHWTWKDTNLENNIDKSENAYVYYVDTANASKTWPLRKLDELRLSVFERKSWKESNMARLLTLVEEKNIMSS